MNKVLNRFSAAYNTWSIFYQTQIYLNKAKKNPHTINDLKISWAQTILKIVNVETRIINAPSENASMLLLGNHISYLDIPLLFATCKNISFVSKSEIRRWPIIGRGAEVLGTVFVNRDKKTSRNLAKETIASELKNNKRIVIFPSGTTCETESKPWRLGAFQIAFENKAMIQPFRITYHPLRRAAYIDDDTFLSHLYLLFKHGKITATIEFHDPVPINDIELDRQAWQNWSRGLLNEVRH